MLKIITKSVLGDKFSDLPDLFRQDTVGGKKLKK